MREKLRDCAYGSRSFAGTNDCKVQGIPFSGTSHLMSGTFLAKNSHYCNCRALMSDVLFKSSADVIFGIFVVVMVCAGIWTGRCHSHSHFAKRSEKRGRDKVKFGVFDRSLSLFGHTWWARVRTEAHK